MQSTCNGSTAQAFSLVPNSGINSSSWFEVVNEGSGLCASAAGGSTANGTAVEQLACTGATSQLWQFVPTSVSGYYEVVNENAQSEGESWNITGGVGATAPGDTLQTWNYGGTGNTNALFCRQPAVLRLLHLRRRQLGPVPRRPIHQQRSSARAVRLQRHPVPGFQPGAMRTKETYGPSMAGPAGNAQSATT